MMKIDLDHYNNLLPEIQIFIDKPNNERLECIFQEKWIPYPKAKEIIDGLSTLLNYPQKSRMPSMLLIGSTNNGKTALLNRFLTMNRAYEVDNQVHIPIVSVFAPPSPDLSGFYSKILNNLAVPYRNTDKTAKKEEMIQYYFSICKTRMLMIDEIHNILSGAVSKQKSFMNALKNLSNELQIPIVLAGIQDALHATNTDAQISNRFKPVFLPKWQVGRDFLSLLASIEKLLPLRRASGLGTTKATALCIADKSEGYIGEMLELITMAAAYAIETGSEVITTTELEKCGFINPSLRKNYLDMVNM